MSKSPFFVVEDFLSIKQTDVLVNTMNILDPDENENGDPIKSVRFSHHGEAIVFDKLDGIREEVEAYYGFNWKGTESMTFEFFPEDCVDGLNPECSNSVYSNRKWVRNKNRDFTGVIFMSDYNDGSDETFDYSYEVFGGKLQFPQHNFSFNPRRGTLIIFPSSPHFIHSISKLAAGDLYLTKFHIVADKPWLYDPKSFPGNFKSWFK